ncbi:hypothetical protein E2C01_022783 [Portunus trituberculatus]|uniref:Uncharacterized protein n=1 Tax=Portunus trituberculatus TaxID=210409 RepID=A0A5B7E878_PORTR|nr:hypothetical protein [Portunus trituberculatus]
MHQAKKKPEMNMVKLSHRCPKNSKMAPMKSRAAQNSLAREVTREESKDVSDEDVTSCGVTAKVIKPHHQARVRAVSVAAFGWHPATQHTSSKKGRPLLYSVALVTSWSNTVCGEVSGSGKASVVGLTYVLLCLSFSKELLFEAFNAKASGLKIALGDTR